MQSTVSALPAVGPYVSLVAAALIVMGSPGPVTVGVTATITAFGLRRSVPYLLGSITGTVAALGVVAVGLASVLLTLPRLGPALLGLSIAYLVWLAWRIATAPPPTIDEGRTRTPPSWPHGLVLGVANPKAYAALGAVFTSQHLGLPTAVLESVVKSLVLAGLVVVVHLGWAAVGASMAAVLRRPKLARLVNLVLAATLLASTVPLVVDLLA